MKEKEIVSKNKFERNINLSDNPDSPLAFNLYRIDDLEKDSFKIFNNIIKRARETKEVAYDIETTGLSPWQDSILTVQLGVKNEEGTIDVVVIRGQHVQNEFRRKLKEILESKFIKVIGHNLSFEYKFSKVNYDIELRNVWDTQITEAALTMGLNLLTSLDNVAERRLEIEVDKTLQKSWIGLPLDFKFSTPQWHYAANDVVVVWPIKDIQEEEVEKVGLSKIIKLEQLIVPILTQVHVDGLLLDEINWDKAKDPKVIRRIELMQQYMELVNIPKPPAVEKPLSLFEEVKITPYDRMKHFEEYSGIQRNKKVMDALSQLGISTTSLDKSSLQSLKGQHPIIELLQEEKEIRTLINNFFLKIPKFINPETGRVHPEYVQLPVFSNSGSKNDSQSGATTGRMSCIASGQQVTCLNSKKSIEDIKKGDYVYCFDNGNKLTLRRVLSLIDSGHRECVEVKWVSSSRSRKGSFICTPEHKIGLADNSWVEAQNVKRGDPLTFVYRAVDHKKQGAESRIRIRSNYGFQAYEEQIIKTDILKLPTEYHVHHINYDSLDNSLDNIKIMTAGEHKALHLEADKRLREDNPLYIKKSKFELLRVLAKAGGKPSKTSISFVTFKEKCDKHNIDYMALKERYNYKGEYISRAKIIKHFNDCIKIEETSKSLGIGARRLKKLCEFYDIEYNHSVTSVTPVGIRKVWDLEIEEFHNFNVGEIKVHNSKNFNAQQIPTDKAIRNCFIARPNYVIGTFDFGSMEVVICGNLSKDPNLIKFFKGEVKDVDGNSVTDFHGYNCSKIFNLPLDDCIKKEIEDPDNPGQIIEIDPVESKKRKLAKIGVFAVIYGASSHGLSRQLKITPEEAEEFLNGMKKAYPKLMKTLEKVANQAVKDQFVMDSIGRRKYFDLSMGAVNRTYEALMKKEIEERGYSNMTPSKAKRIMESRAKRQAGNFIIQCVHPNTNLWLKDTGLTKIRDKENCEVEVWDGNRFSKAFIVKSKEKKRLATVTLLNGIKIRCSPEHQFKVLTHNAEDEFIEAKSLNAIGTDYVYLSNKISMSNELSLLKDKDIYLAKLFGRIAGQGGFIIDDVIHIETYNDKSSTKIFMYKSFENIFKCKIIEEKIDDNTIVYIKDKTLSAEFSKLDIKNKIPDLIKSSGILSLVYVQSLFDSKTKFKDGRITARIQSKELAEEIQKLLQFMGCISDLRSNGNYSLLSMSIDYYYKIKNVFKENTDYKPVVGVESVTISNECIDMYDVVNSETEKFCADGVIVHNSMCANQLKYAMLNVAKEFPDREELRILMLVHDEIVVEMREDGAYERAQRVKEIMVESATKVLRGPIEYSAGGKIEKGWTK